MTSGSVARSIRDSVKSDAAHVANENQQSANPSPLTILLAVPTLQAGAADHGVVDLVSILANAGHRAIVVSRGGRLEQQVTANGGLFIPLDVASKNPFVMARNAARVAQLVRKHRCDVIHAHGRAPAWSCLLAARWTRIPFVTSWYKGFREQNIFKRLYNRVMACGDRIVAISDQIAELIADRYGIAWDRIDVVPACIDLNRFDPEAVSAERIECARKMLGADDGSRIILVVGRMSRRKGHHLVVQAARRLREMGLKDFTCVFVGEDPNEGRYGDEVWDLVLATGTADIMRLSPPVDDMPAVYAASTIVVSAATQAEGLPRALLEAQAMERPVVVSDLGAGPEVVLAPPAVPEDRMTGLRFSAGDEAALEAAIIRLFSLPDSALRAIGARGREWVRNHFDAPSVIKATLKVYAQVTRMRP